MKSIFRRRRQLTFKAVQGFNDAKLECSASDQRVRGSKRSWRWCHIAICRHMLDSDYVHRWVKPTLPKNSFYFLNPLGLWADGSDATTVLTDFNHSFAHTFSNSYYPYAPRWIFWTTMVSLFICDTFTFHDETPVAQRSHSGFGPRLIFGVLAGSHPLLTRYIGFWLCPSKNRRLASQKIRTAFKLYSETKRLPYSSDLNEGLFCCGRRGCFSAAVMVQSSWKRGIKVVGATGPSTLWLLSAC